MKEACLGIGTGSEPSLIATLFPMGFIFLSSLSIFRRWLLKASDVPAVLTAQRHTQAQSPSLTFTRDDPCVFWNPNFAPTAISVHRPSLLWGHVSVGESDVSCVSAHVPS